MADALGSVRQMADDNGAVILARDYTPFGLLRAEAGTGSSGYGFTGEQQHAVLGLVYLRARYFSPSLGRFLSVDPFPGYPGLPGTLHPYAYCLNDAINCTDPSGELPPWLQFVAGLGYQYLNDVMWGLPDLASTGMSPRQSQIFFFALTGWMIPEEQIPLVEHLVVTQLQGPIIASSVGVLGAPRLAEAQMLIAGVEAGIQPCSPAFQRGRQFGRTVSNIQSVVEIVVGALTMLSAVTIGPPLDAAAVLAGGGVASWATGGAAVAVNVGVLEAGGALVTHGVGVLARNRGDPVPNISYAKQSGTGGSTGQTIWTPGQPGDPVKNAYSHWKKHRAEFPEYENALQYVEGAWSFVTDTPAGTLVKTRTNGDVLFYHPGSNTFAVTNSAGVPRTMFRPTNGMGYWNAQ